jgi:TRAP-type C4-dicarboxylate transport system permease large subunit
MPPSAMIAPARMKNTASIGSVMIPQMEEKGYPRDFAAAVTASGSVQGEEMVTSPPVASE